MTVTKNKITKVFSPKGEHIATIRPHMSNWMLEKKIKGEWLGFVFPTAEWAIANAH